MPKDIRKRRAGPIAAIVLIIALMALYPLSIGPLAAAHYHGWISDQGWEALQTFYYPIRVIAGYERLQRGLSWYIELWLPSGSVVEYEQ
jgi:hypothetical protein